MFRNLCYKEYIPESGSLIYPLTQNIIVIKIPLYPPINIYRSFWPPNAPTFACKIKFSLGFSSIVEKVLLCTIFFLNMFCCNLNLFTLKDSSDLCPEKKDNLWQKSMSLINVTSMAIFFFLWWTIYYCSVVFWSIIALVFSLSYSFSFIDSNKHIVQSILHFSC